MLHGLRFTTNPWGKFRWEKLLAFFQLVLKCLNFAQKCRRIRCSTEKVKWVKYHVAPHPQQQVFSFSLPFSLFRCSPSLLTVALVRPLWLWALGEDEAGRKDGLQPVRQVEVGGPSYPWGVEGGRGGRGVEGRGEGGGRGVDGAEVGLGGQQGGVVQGGGDQEGAQTLLGRVLQVEIR